MAGRCGAKEVQGEEVQVGYEETLKSVKTG